MDHHVDHVPANLFQCNLRAVLGGEHYRVHPDGPSVFVLHSDLGLAVWPQIVHQTHLTHLGQPLGHLVGQGDGQGHQLRRLVAGVAKHHALVAGAVLKLSVLALLVLQRLIHAHGDVAGLLVNVGDNAAGVTVKAVLGPVIADVPDHFPGKLCNVHVATGADLAHDVHQAGGNSSLTGHPSLWVLGQNRVQHRVGNLVADLIGMSLCYGFRGK